MASCICVNNNNNLIYIVPACPMISEALGQLTIVDVLSLADPGV